MGERPRLIVSIAETRKRLTDRVKEGRALKDREIIGTSSMERAHLERNKWKTYNIELLKSLFDSEEFAIEYQNLVPTRVFDGLNYLLDAGLFRHDMNLEINKLETIAEISEFLLQVKGVSSNLTPQHLDESSSTKGKQVFIVHGHDEEAKQSAARFIEKLGLKTLILHEQPGRGRTIIQKFEDYSDVAYAVVLLTPDDIAHPKDKPEEAKTRARQNVILELGYFLGKLGHDKVCALCKGELEIPSDYLGVIYVPMDSGGMWRPKLLRELKASGIDIDSNRALEALD